MAPVVNTCVTPIATSPVIADTELVKARILASVTSSFNAMELTTVLNPLIAKSSPLAATAEKLLNLRECVPHLASSFAISPDPSNAVVTTCPMCPPVWVDSQVCASLSLSIMAASAFTTPDLSFSFSSQRRFIKAFSLCSRLCSLSFVGLGRPGKPAALSAAMTRRFITPSAKTIEASHVASEPTMAKSLSSKLFCSPLGGFGISCRYFSKLSW